MLGAQVDDLQQLPSRSLPPSSAAVDRCRLRPRARPRSRRGADPLPPRPRPRARTPRVPAAAAIAPSSARARRHRRGARCGRRACRSTDRSSARAGRPAHALQPAPTLRGEFLRRTDIEQVASCAPGPRASVSTCAASTKPTPRASASARARCCSAPRSRACLRRELPLAPFSSFSPARNQPCVPFSSATTGWARRSRSASARR